MKVRAHTCYLGNTGFASHARNFFRELSKYVDLRIRNYTWDPNPEFDNIDYSILDTITLRDSNGIENDYHISNSFPNLPWNNNNFQQDVDIVLMEMNHKYFYDKYTGLKIAYTVWESTELDKDFFNQLLTFDYLWVVSQWHKDQIIKQGYPEDKISIVNEGVSDIKRKSKKNDKFQFLFFGRWDYRKSVPEILNSFINAFPNNNNIELILSADNKFSKDNLKSTEDRLKHHNINDDRIKVIHFPNREEYINYLNSGNVLITCARSEGWNIPLIEAMSVGTPVIYSKWGAQLEFANNLGNPVKIIEERPANIGYDLGLSLKTPGLYAEPDFKDLEKVLIDCYENYSLKKEIAESESIIINSKFNWDNISKSAVSILNNIIPTITYNYNDGPFVEIIGGFNHRYNIKFINKKNNEILYSVDISRNSWAKCSIKYYIDWRIEIKNLNTDEIIIDNFNLNNKIVRIKLESSSLGDTIAWLQHIYVFSIIQSCTVVVSTFKNFLFDFEKYPNLIFVEPNQTINSYTTYEIGWFYNGNTFDQFKNPRDFKNIPLQQTTTDILGINYYPLKPYIKVNNFDRPIREKYICIAIHSTAQAKYWNNPDGWQYVVDYYKQQGLKVVIVSSESDGYMGNSHPVGCEYMTDNSMNTLITYLYNCEFFIGVSSGISWLSWALNKKTVIISGFSKPITEPSSDNVIRIINEKVCNGCFNTHKLDAGDWNWCPLNKGTDMQFECSKSITGDYVIDCIEKRK